MKTLLVYSSRTGNTERVANEIYDELKPSMDIEFKKFEDLQEGEEDNYETVIVGFWIDQAYPEKKVRKFIESLRNKKVAMFATIGANPDSYHGERTLGNLETLPDESCELKAKFLCNGKVDPNLVEKLKKMDRTHLPPGLNAEVLDQMIAAGETSREPNEEDFANARRVFREAFLG